MTMATVHETLTAILAAIRPNNIPPVQKAALNAFRQEVAQFLQQRFPLHFERAGEPFTMGSHEKGTDTCLNHDIDLFVPFKKDFKLGPKGMKAAVFAALQERFPTPPTVVRDQRVSIGLQRQIGDMLLVIDVVPGMEQKLNQYKDKPSKEEEPKAFLLLYDRESNCERTTNVHRQSRLIKEKMLNFRDTVRLLKAWRHKEQHIISSYALELMVYRAAVAKGAPATGAPDLLLKHVLQHNIPLLESNQSLHDFGANYDWPDFLKPAAKTQLAGRWKKLLDALTAHDTTQLRSFFP
jgi:hypothetical protein